MIPISTEMEGLVHPLALRADEYLNEDNLICCSRCHTPRQKRIEVAGMRMEPRCMCACQIAAHEKREQERKHREFLDMVERNRSVGLPDPELRKHTFENDLFGVVPQIVLKGVFLQLRVRQTHAAVSFYHIQELPVFAFLLPLIIVSGLAGTHASRFHSFPGHLDPLLPGSPALAAADQAVLVQVFILPERNRVDETFYLSRNRDHKLSPSS